MNKIQSKISKIGFMQGRLSPLIENKIQAFPWKNWKDEFSLADSIGLRVMEWTLDHERLYINPIMTKEGRDAINTLISQFNISIPSLTGDCFMQKPFWKYKGNKRNKLERDFLSITESCGHVGIKYIVVPLVDNGSIENPLQCDILLSFLEENKKFFDLNKIQIVFESDFNPEDLKRFIDNFDPDIFGINYDIGNSAFLGYDPKKEFEAYGKRILNVHVKDRPYNGITVPLGEGDADFASVFSLLNEYSYNGNYILQTARSNSNEHLSILNEFHQYTQHLIVKAGASDS